MHIVGDWWCLYPWTTKFSIPQGILQQHRPALKFGGFKSPVLGDRQKAKVRFSDFCGNVWDISCYIPLISIDFLIGYVLKFAVKSDSLTFCILWYPDVSMPPPLVDLGTWLKFSHMEQPIRWSLFPAHDAQTKPCGKKIQHAITSAEKK